MGTHVFLRSDFHVVWTTGGVLKVFESVLYGCKEGQSWIERCVVLL